MKFQSPGDIAFSLSGFSVYYYGIILAVAIFTGIYTAYYLYKKFYGNKNANYIFDFSPYIILIGILGARLYYCLVNFNYYLLKPIEILDIRQGGLSVHGMIFAGIISLYVFARIYKISFLKLFDVFACGAALAQAVGRWGNFFNSEAFGLPTNLPWKLFVPVQKRPIGFLNYEYFHPTFLYESILDLLIFIILVFIFKYNTKHPGTIACIYLILYSVARILVEQIRIDSVFNILGIPVAQITSLLIIIAAVIALPFILKHNSNNT